MNIIWSCSLDAYKVEQFCIDCALFLRCRLHLDNIKKLQNAESEKNRIGKNQDLTAVEKFGFPTTTCCGYIAQDNEWHDDWVVSVASQVHK